jgi:hypothetical protein
MGLSTSNGSKKRAGYVWRAALVGLLFGLIAAGATAQEFSVTDVTAAEDAAAVTFTVTLTGASGTYSYSVDYATADGTATTTDSDYTADSGTLNFSDTGPNTTTATVTVVIGADALDETDETLSFTLTNAAGGAALDTNNDLTNASGADNVATGTVTNDDVPTISITGATVVEGVGGATTVATLTVTLSNASTADITVVADTADGTATIADLDYNAIVAQTVTVPAGLTSAAIGVTVNDDAIDEPDETITLNLSSAAGGASATPPTISGASATVTITNDDVPTILIADVAVSEITGLAQAVVTLTNASTADVTVVADSSDGTASAASDYTAVVATTVTIPAGSTTSTVDITITDDSTKEINETLTITLSSPAGGATGTAPTIADATGVVTIINDDSALPATSLTVQVNDGTNPIDGALVTVFDGGTTTPATVADVDPHKLTVSGAVTFAGLLEGAAYDILVTGGSLGYLENTATIASFAGTHTETVSLTTTSVLILVQDEGASAIAGANVAINGLSAVTDGSGVATLTQVPTKAGPEDAGSAATDLVVAVTGPADATVTTTTRYQDASLTPVNVSETAATDLTTSNPITLLNVRLTVTVTGEDASGAQAVLDGATVTLTGPETVSLDTAGGGGVADFGDPGTGGGILAGDYLVTVVEPGYVTSADPTPVTVATTATGALALAVDYTSITLHVSSGGIDIAGVAVAADIGGSVVTPPRTIPSPAVTDAGGLVELRGLDGTSGVVHTLTMTKSGFVTSTTSKSATLPPPA